MDRKLSKELRGKKRGPLSVSVSFSEQTEGTTGKNIRKSTTADLSSSGLGIFSEVELKPDTIIEIECSDIWDAPKKFSVKWCNKVRYNFYRIGLEVKNKS